MEHFRQQNRTKVIPIQTFWVEDSVLCSQLWSQATLDVLGNFLLMWAVLEVGFNFQFQFKTGTSESGFLKFEKWKVKIKSFHSFSRSAKWNQNAFTLFREVKSEIKCFEIEKWKFLRILNHSRETRFLTDFFRESQIRMLKQMACSWGIIKPARWER